MNKRTVLVWQVSDDKGKCLINAVNILLYFIKCVCSADIMIVEEFRPRHDSKPLLHRSADSFSLTLSVVPR